MWLFKKKEYNSDEELLKHYKQSGNKDLFADLFKKHVSVVYGTCLFYLQDKDEAQEAAEVAEEEAEMARREEALTIEEENLQREIRETERSDNEGDETWDEPINVTPVCLVISCIYFCFQWFNST